MHLFPATTANVTIILHAKHGSKDVTLFSACITISITDKTGRLASSVHRGAERHRADRLQEAAVPDLNAQSGPNADSLNHLICCCAQ